MNKDAIRHTFIGQLMISCLHIAECKIMPMLLDDETAVRKMFRKKAGYELNLENPQTFSEKLNWYKLNDRNPLMAKCADKIAVREYLTEKGYGDMLNEIFGVYDKVSDIDIDALPEQFVLKAAHGSHMNVIVTDKKAVNWTQQKLLMRTWLKQNIYWSGREWVYKDLPKRILAEKYLEDETGELRDYKFFCFNGVPRYMQMDFGRFTGKQQRNYYDMQLQWIDIFDGIPSDKNEPCSLSEDTFFAMKTIAADIAKDFSQFVRIDFYALRGKIYIGELTFFDGGGFVFFEPKEINVVFAENWDITK